mmetsp:Transcript_4299/g.27378  ORF Transcript_4299/g.27378 Transcript_4299/m.27378 type:complete len:95 (-) Transcript_4299:633-917(-)
MGQGQIHTKSHICDMLTFCSDDPLRNQSAICSGMSCNQQSLPVRKEEWISRDCAHRSIDNLARHEYSTRLIFPIQLLGKEDTFVYYWRRFVHRR